MATFSEALNSGVQTAFCTALPDVIAGGLLFTALTAETGAGAIAGLATSGGAALAYGLFCNRELPPSAQGSPPFSGGQCSGVQYRITTGQQYHRLNPVLNGSQGQNTLAVGPIRVVQFLTNYSFRDDTVLRIVDATGERVISVNPATNDPDTTKWFTYDNFTTSIARVDNLPDTCGNPVPVPVPIPPGGNSVTAPVTYNNRNGDTITNNYTFTFGYAQVNVNGQLLIPVSIRNNITPTLSLTANLNLSTGGINVNFGDPGNPVGGGEPCSNEPANPVGVPPGLPSLPPSAPKPPEAVARPERRKVMRGALVTVTQLNPNTTTIFQDDDPDIYVPDLGFISFLCQVGGVTGWTAPIKVNNVRQIIECPWISGAIDVKGTPRVLNRFTITPLYTQQSYPKQYPPE